MNKKNVERFPLGPMALDNDIMNSYKEELEYVLKNKDIKNVALSGIYGSGKSSIIKSFYSGKNRKKYLTITIGSFIKGYSLNNNSSFTNNFFIDSTNHSIEKKDDNDINENFDDSSFKDGKIDNNELNIVDKIESSILRQLVYINSNEKMNKSSIKRISTFPFHNLSFIYVILYIFMLFFCFLYIKFNVYQMIDSLNLVKIIYFFDKYINFFTLFLIASFIVFFICLSCNVSRFVNKVYFTNISKIKLNEYELELNSNSNLSFSKNLYEILYIFYINKIECVTFEDIDRFSDDIVLKVMEELKELNTIINNFYNSLILYPKKVTFIYSFRDDIFEKKEDRTKFYDYIITVMPVSSSYNSLMKINMLLSPREKNKLDSNIIKLFSEYFVDLRLIYSVINDFRLMDRLLPDGDINKKLSIAMYKNYENKRYCDIFGSSRDENFLVNRIDELKGKVLNSKKKLENNIEELINDNLKLEKKLNDLKKSLIKINNISLKTKVYINNSVFYFEDLFNFDFDIKVILNSDSIFYYKNNEKILVNFEIDDTIYDLNSFINEFKIIFTSYEANMYNIKIKNDILTKDNLYILDNTNFLKNNEASLLDVLILYNYIDYDYIDYITLPNRSKEIGKNENSFIFNFQHKISSFDLKIKINEAFLDIIKPYFDSKYILNYYLVSYMINNKNFNSNLYKIFMSIFDSLDDYIVDFFESLYIYDSDLYFSLFNELAFFNKDVYNIIEKSDLKNVDKAKKVISIGYLYSFKNLNIKNNEEFNSYINEYFDDNFLIKYRNKICDNLLLINFRFNDISIYSMDNIDFIINNMLFEINDSNFISIFLGYNISLFKTFVLCDNEDNIYYEVVLKNIFNHLDEFQNLYCNSKIKIGSVELINKIILNKFNSQFYSNLCKKIINREDFIVNPKKINNNYLTLCFNYNHILVNWNNIYYCYKNGVHINYIVDKISQNDFLFELSSLKGINFHDYEFWISVINYFIKINKFDYLERLLDLLLNNQYQFNSYVTLDYSLDINLLNKLFDLDTICYSKNNSKIIASKNDIDLSYKYCKFINDFTEIDNNFKNIITNIVDEFGFEIFIYNKFNSLVKLIVFDMYINRNKENIQKFKNMLFKDGEKNKILYSRKNITILNRLNSYLNREINNGFIIYYKKNDDYEPKIT